MGMCVERRGQKTESWGTPVLRGRGEGANKRRREAAASEVLE